MKKNLGIIKIGFQKAFAFKSDAILSIAESIIPAIASVYLWFAIYKSGGSISGYTMNELITYFIAARLINYLVLYAVDWVLNSDIHNGNLNKLLLKPVSAFKYHFFIMIGDRLGQFVLGILPLSILCIFLREYISINSNFQMIILGLIAVILSMILWFVLSWIVATAAFFLENAFMLLLVKDSLMLLLTGSIFPIDFFPDIIQQILRFMPFPLITYFPINVLFSENYTEQEVIFNLGLQIFWILILLLISKLFFDKGLKRYSSVGG